MDDITKSDRYSGYDISKIDVSLFTVAKQEEADTYEEITTKPYNYWGSVGKGLIRKRTFDVSFILVLVIVLLAIIVPIGKVAHPIDDYYAFAPPSWDHLFGIGNENEDYWTTLWIGTNQTLYFVGLIIVVQILLGTGIGLLWGYQKLYSPAMEWIIKIFKHIPQIVLWVVVVYLFDLANQKNNMFVVVLAVSVTSWVPIAEKISVSVRRTRLSNLYNSSMSLGLSKAKIFSKQF
jgi:oligopeptide transport system permease protein